MSFDACHREFWGTLDFRRACRRIGLRTGGQRWVTISATLRVFDSVLELWWAAEICGNTVCTARRSRNSLDTQGGTLRILGSGTSVEVASLVLRSSANSIRSISSHSQRSQLRSHTCNQAGVVFADGARFTHCDSSLPHNFHSKWDGTVLGQEAMGAQRWFS